MSDPQGSRPVSGTLLFAIFALAVSMFVAGWNLGFYMGVAAGD